MPLHIPFSQQQPGTWRGGQVNEIFRDPPDADFPNSGYRLWAGTATIERAADYSDFAKAERLHVLLAGGGLLLQFREPEEAIPLATGGWLTFAGDRPLHAVPVDAVSVDGPVFAFNLIYPQGATSGARFFAAADMPVVLPGVTAVGARLTRIVYGIQGESSVESGQDHFRVRAGDTLVFSAAESAQTSIRLINQTPDARLLLAHVLESGQPTTSA